MKKLYLAYGSNLHAQQMRLRCPDATLFGVGTIPDYQLLFKGSQTGSYLTIEQKEGGCVPVAVWSISEADEQSLDRYEGYPSFYYKQQLRLPVLRDGKPKTVTAFVYIMREERPFGIPSSYYVQTCTAGYLQFGFDLKYLRKAIAISRREVNHHEAE